MAETRIPILMYHALMEKPNPSVSKVHIEICRFEQQMAWLAGEGYTTISLPELLKSLQQNIILIKPIVITFDDGYASLYQYAAPILKKHGYSASLFLTTNTVGHSDYSSLPQLNLSIPQKDRPLNWPELKALSAAGWDIQAHSCTHARHTLLKQEQILNELRESKRKIERELHKNVSFYAFPYGSYNVQALLALAQSGYEAGFSVHVGMASAGDDLRRIPRIEINSSCNLNAFKRKVQSGYQSISEEYRSKARNFLFKSLVVRDFMQRVTNGLIN